MGTTVLKHKQTIHAYNNRLRCVVQYHLKIIEKCDVGENEMMGRDFERNSNNWMGFSGYTIWVRIQGECSPTKDRNVNISFALV